MAMATAHYRLSSNPMESDVPLSPKRQSDGEMEEDQDNTLSPPEDMVEIP